MKQKVYCGYCKHYILYDDGSVIEECKNKKAKLKIRDSHLKQYKDVMFPHEINKNNDCKYYTHNKYKGIKI